MSVSKTINTASSVSSDAWSLTLYLPTTKNNGFNYHTNWLKDQIIDHNPIYIESRPRHNLYKESMYNILLPMTKRRDPIASDFY